MSKNYSYNLCIQKKEVVNFFKDLILNHTDLIRKSGDIEKFNIKEVTEKNILNIKFSVEIYSKTDEYLKELPYIKSTKEFIRTKGEYCVVDAINLYIKPLKKIEGFVHINFQAQTSTISDIFIESDSVRKLFKHFCKKYNPLLCFLDIESLISILWPINIEGDSIIDTSTEEYNDCFTASSTQLKFIETFLLKK